MLDMTRLYRHIARTFIAGIVAILPIGALVVSIGYLESTISGAGLSGLPFYFPGLGLLAALLLIYLIGLGVSTFIGRWTWNRVDGVLNRLPALSTLYQTFKQILGYGQGEDAIFLEAVLVPSRDYQAEEFGLVTNRIPDEKGDISLVIFVPGSPSPTAGRLLIMSEKSVKRLAIPVNEAFKALVSVGKTEIDLEGLKTATGGLAAPVD
jgi:uncharacterized membrane protein